MLHIKYIPILKKEGKNKPERGKKRRTELQ